MDVIQWLAPSTDIFVSIDGNVGLGAPDDITTLQVTITYSSTRRLAGDPTWIDAVWQTDPFAVPLRRWVKGAVASAQLAEGVWYPFVKIATGGDEEPIVAGKPFRVSGGSDVDPGPDDGLLPVGLLVREVVFDAIDIAHMFSAPVELIPAPGPGRAVAIVQLVAEFAAGAGGWGVASDLLLPFYDDGNAPGDSDNLALSSVGPLGIKMAQAPVSIMTVANLIFVTPNRDTIDNRAIKLAAQSFEPFPLTPIVTLGDPSTGSEGVGYVVGDVLSIENYAGDEATVRVDAVNGFGAIQAVTLTDVGQGYRLGEFTATGGSGSGAAFQVTGVAAPDGELHVRIVYQVIQLHLGT